MEMLNRLLEFRGEVGTGVINLGVIGMDMVIKDLGVNAPRKRSPSIDI